MTKYTQTQWQEQAEKLRQGVDKRPILKIQDVMRILGLRSTGAAHYALEQIAKVTGEVVNSNDEWRLVK